MKHIIKFLFLVSLFAACSGRQEELKLPALFSDHMVLQQQAEVPIWGWAAPGSKIRITASWGQKAATKAGKDGKWQVKLKTPASGDIQTIRITNGKQTVLLEDVALGEVWLCSGQSNMEMPLAGWPPNDTINNSATEIASASYPNLRMFTVDKTVSVTPQDICSGSWKVCDPENAGAFSATAYFFGKELHRELGVPVGLIHTSWGGTPAESWTHLDYLSEVPGYEKVKAQFEEARGKIAVYNAWLDSLRIVKPDSENSVDPYQNIDLGDSQLKNTDYEDSDWDTLSVPSFLENRLGYFDGAIWFRKEFSFNGDINSPDYKLYLGPIDDLDATYLNGTRIGGFEKEGSWQVIRSYPIPQGILRQGNNILAVRVIDLRGGGGIYGNKKPGILKNDKTIVNLGGSWKYKPVALISGNGFYIFGEGRRSFQSMPETGIQLSPNMPSALYNAMIAPLIPFAIKGAIWYQGESNVGRGKQYRILFPAMIRSWREQWKQGDFPFYYVQIAPYNYDEKVPGITAELREAQLLTMQVDNTGMVVTMDIGKPYNIHPGNKQEVGRRLSLWALAKTYGRDSLVYSGPVFSKMDVTGNKAIVYFTNTGSGLYCPDKELSHFELAGNDLKFFPATAVIYQNTVVVQSPKVKEPKIVRYSWSDKAEPNLFNREGLPASPFRSAEW
jgi:sialate O-acetylesterase